MVKKDLTQVRFAPAWCKVVEFGFEFTWGICFEVDDVLRLGLGLGFIW